MSTTTTKTRTVLASKDKGLFLGQHGDVAVFANLNDMGTYKACSFSDQEEAKYFLQNYIPNDDDEYFFIDIDTNMRYIPCTELIKRGHHEICGKMIFNIPSQSDAIH